MYDIREYRTDDTRSWLLCRLLSFFDTDYYDDVKRQKTTFSWPSVELVAVDDRGDVVGLVDIEINGRAATIDSIAVHPESQRHGVGGALLNAALKRLPATVSTLDAWTREDPGANCWYQAAGFRENYRYLHIYRSDDDPTDGSESPPGLSKPVNAFLHAAIEHETAVRADYRRVYVCRQYIMDLTALTGVDDRFSERHLRR